MAILPGLFQCFLGRVAVSPKFVAIFTDRKPGTWLCVAKELQARRVSNGQTHTQNFTTGRKIAAIGVIVCVGRFPGLTKY